MKKVSEIKVGDKFRTEDGEVVRNFVVINVTDKRITTTSETGYAHMANVNMMRCHSFGVKQVQRYLDQNLWIF